MIKYYCDCCSQEIKDRSYDVKLLCHITTENPLTGHSKIVDGKSHPVSGREEIVMMCLPCYNEAMYFLWDKIKLMKEKV